LEKRQRRGGGFLSGSVNRKNIVKSLQTSVMRQQAQVGAVDQVVGWEWSVVGMECVGGGV
jgi:hypothetical protein